jgi:hypothetical protein
LSATRLALTNHAEPAETAEHFDESDLGDLSGLCVELIYRGSRTIGKIGGAIPSRISATTSNPCRRYRLTLLGLVDSR